MKAKRILNDQWTILEVSYIPSFSSLAFQEKEVKHLRLCYGQAEQFKLYWTQLSLHGLTAGNNSNATRVKAAVKQPKPALPTGLGEV